MNIQGEGTINILTGEDAVREFEENGAEGCKEKGFNCVEKIYYDEQTSPEDFAREILSRVSGQLDSKVISQEDADIIDGE